MTVRFDRLEAGQPITSGGQGPSLPFQVWAQTLVEQVEEAVNNVETLLNTVIDLNDLITTVETAAATAQDAATAAQTAATAANDAADAAAAQTALVASYPTGLTITATDAGANVTISISAHTRAYPQADGSITNVAVNAGSITGLAYSTDYWIYYDDAARAGGAVTYAATTSPTTGAQVGDRHAVGAVTTPVPAAPPTGGNVLRNPGFVQP